MPDTMDCWEQPAAASLVATKRKDVPYLKKSKTNKDIQSNQTMQTSQSNPASLSLCNREEGAIGRAKSKRKNSPHTPSSTPKADSASSALRTVAGSFNLIPMLHGRAIFIAAVFAFAGLVKGVIGLGLPTISMDCSRSS